MIEKSFDFQMILADKVGKPALLGQLIVILLTLTWKMVITVRDPIDMCNYKISLRRII